MTRSRDLSATQSNIGGAVAPFVAGKNFFINGSMDIAQRGTTFTGVNSVYTLDRWYYASYGTSTTANVSQGSTDSVPGIQYYARFAANSSTNSNYNLTQTIETANVIPLRGKVVTLSFWWRVPVSFTNTFVLNLRYTTTTDTRISNAGTGTAVGSDLIIAGTSSWAKVTQTFTIPTDASSLGFVLGTYNNTVSTAYFDITGVQLELGAQATPFARAGGSIGGELALCQRYCYKVTNETVATLASGGYYAPSVFLAAISFPVTMRTAPTGIVVNGISYWGIYANSAIDYGDTLTVSRATNNACNLELGGSVAGTNGFAGQLAATNVAASLILSSEL